MKADTPTNQEERVTCLKFFSAGKQAIGQKLSWGKKGGLCRRDAREQ